MCRDQPRGHSVDPSTLCRNIPIRTRFAQVLPQPCIRLLYIDINSKRVEYWLGFKIHDTPDLSLFKASPSEKNHIANIAFFATRWTRSSLGGIAKPWTTENVIETNGKFKMAKRPKCYENCRRRHRRLQKSHFRGRKVKEWICSSGWMIVSILRSLSSLPFLLVCTSTVIDYKWYFRISMIRCLFKRRKRVANWATTGAQTENAPMERQQVYIGLNGQKCSCMRRGGGRRQR